MRLGTALALTAALFTAGCWGPSQPTSPVKRPIAYTSQQQKVEVLTRAVSLSKNGALEKTTESLQRMTGALLVSFLSLSQLGAGASPRYEVARALRGTGEPGAYRLAAVLESGAVTLEYDEATREVTRLVGQDFELGFKFANGEKTRSLDVALLKSPDGSTGHLHVTMTANTWKGADKPLERPFAFAADQTPVGIEAATLRLAFTPQGDAKAAVALEAELSDVRALGPVAAMPGAFKLSAQVPELTFKLTGTVQGEGRRYTAKTEGSLLVALPEGDEQFLFALDSDEARGAFELTNVGAKVKLVYAGAHDEKHKVGTLVSSEDGSTLGTVEAVENRPGRLLVKLKDGQKIEWELFPKTMLPSLPKLG